MVRRSAPLRSPGGRGNRMAEDPAAGSTSRHLRYLAVTGRARTTARLLPYYAQADNVLLKCAHYDGDLSLVLTGRASGFPGDRKEVEKLITWLFANDSALKTMVAPYPNLRVKLSLDSQPFDAEASERIRRARSMPWSAVVCQDSACKPSTRRFS